MVSLVSLTLYAMIIYGFIGERPDTISGATGSRLPKLFFSVCRFFSSTSNKNFNWNFALSYYVIDPNNEFQESLEDYFDHVHTDGELWI